MVRLGGNTAQKRQEAGIKQGCTLPPSRLKLILSLISKDVECTVRRRPPASHCLTRPALDLRFADAGHTYGQDGRGN